MQLTKAQEALLDNLNKGAQIVYRRDHYMVANDDSDSFIETNLWPSTFYGLYDERLIEKNDLGGYSISDEGREHLCSLSS